MSTIRTLVLAAVLAVAAGGALAQEKQPLEPQRIPPSGAMLGRNCITCHGQGAAGEGAIPALRSLSAEAIVAAMRDFRSGKRRGTIMNRIAAGYSPDEDRLVAQFLSSLR
jgi:sulfide dehydrogenase cytochrome subunit